MSKTVELLDRETGATTRRLLLDAKEAVANDPGRFEVIGKPVKTGVAVVAEQQGSGPHALRVGRLKFEPEPR